MNKFAPRMNAKRLHEAFPQEQQLDDSLVLVDNQVRRKPKSGRRSADGAPPNLPGHPTTFLDNIKELESHVTAEFHTPKLDRMAPHLWLMASPYHHFISALHEQLVRNRRIIITENPELHLVWIDDRIFIKPIPRYLMSHAFWQRYLESSVSSPFQPSSTDVIKPAVLGFLRSWTYLVRHESDFVIAQNTNLIPRGVQYAKFMRFILNFRHPSVKDDEVSLRYRYGQLRLSRLNMWAKVFLRESEFYPAYWQYWQYFQTFYAPLLFVFAVFTVILGAMQVGLTAPDIWPAFVHVSVWFSVVTLLLIVAVALLMIGLYLVKILNELFFAIRARIGTKEN